MIIDLDHLDRATHGDPVLRHELLVLFHQQLQTLEGIVRVGALPAPSDLAATLHRLRGAAQAMGATTLARDLASVENAADASASDGPDRDPLVPLRSSLQSTREAVQALIAAQVRPGLAKAGESG